MIELSKEARERLEAMIVWSQRLDALAVKDVLIALDAAVAEVALARSMMTAWHERAVAAVTGATHHPACASVCRIKNEFCSMHMDHAACGCGAMAIEFQKEHDVVATKLKELEAKWNRWALTAPGKALQDAYEEGLRVDSECLAKAQAETRAAVAEVVRLQISHGVRRRAFEDLLCAATASTDASRKEVAELRQLLIATVPDDLIVHAEARCPSCGDGLVARIGTELKAARDASRMEVEQLRAVLRERDDVDQLGCMNPSGEGCPPYHLCPCCQARKALAASPQPPPNALTPSSEGSVVTATDGRFGGEPSANLKFASPQPATEPTCAWRTENESGLPVNIACGKPARWRSCVPFVNCATCDEHKCRCATLFPSPLKSTSETCRKPQSPAGEVCKCIYSSTLGDTLPDYNGCTLHGPNRFSGFPATGTDPACGFVCPKCGFDTPHSHPNEASAGEAPVRVTLVSGRGEDADLLRVPTEDNPRMPGEVERYYVRADISDRLADLATALLDSGLTYPTHLQREAWAFLNAYKKGAPALAESNVADRAVALLRGLVTLLKTEEGAFYSAYAGKAHAFLDELDAKGGAK